MSFETLGYALDGEGLLLLLFDWSVDNRQDDL